MEAVNLKEQLGERAKQIIADGLNFREVGGKVLCPLHMEKTPSMTWYKKGNMWRCHACRENIDIFRYYTEFEHMSFQTALQTVAELVGEVSSSIPVRVAPEEYDRPDIRVEPLSQEFKDYMNARKISNQTLEDWRVGQTMWGGNPVYVFQYFDENGDRPYVTFRGLGKGATKGGCVSNTKPILWGMWHIDPDKPVVVTEGQPDAMAVWESGYKNVVSVPNGTNNLKWIDTCWDWLQGKELIVFADNDARGLEMAEAIHRKLDGVRIIKDFGRKDANEVLFYDGKEAIMDLITRAIESVPHGVIDVSATPYSLTDNFDDRIETGLSDYDAHIEDLKLEEVTILFGRNGEGKSTLISQIIGHNLNNRQGIFLYSGEMSDRKIQTWLYTQLVGGDPDCLQIFQGKYRERVEPTVEAVERIKAWHRGLFYLYDRDADGANHLDKFFATMELVARRNNVKLFIVDNLMSIIEERAESLLSDQANFVQRCKDFAIRHRVHIILVAHANKEKGECGGTGNLEKRDIMGSSNISNKADNIIAFERLWQSSEEFDAVLTSLKDRETGQRKSFYYNMSKETLRFYNDKVAKSVRYTWRNGFTPTKREVEGFPIEGFEPVVGANTPFD